MAQARPIRTRFSDDGAGTPAGWLVAVMLQLLLALPPSESLTVAVKLLLLNPLGVPVTTPVAVFKLKPEGSAPVIEYV
jgi:hypothetical protein